MSKRRIKASSLAKRITGFSLPVIGGGLSWKPKEDERSVIRKLIVFLEDKRALYIVQDREIPDYVRMSLSEIRKTITETMQDIDEDSPAMDGLRVMRTACTSFETRYGHLDWRHRNEYDQDFFIQLGMLRAVFGHQIAVLGFLYKIDIGEELASILPPEVQI